MATDLAEVIGSAVALKLLFHIPLPLAYASPVLDVLYPTASVCFVAVGIIGVTVMPHDLFLHSPMVLTRAFDRSDAAAVKQAHSFAFCTLGLSTWRFLWWPRRHFTAMAIRRWQLSRTLTCSSRQSLEKQRALHCLLSLCSRLRRTPP